jgi:hypothetical protein
MKTNQKIQFSSGGIIRCGRYAFMPNKLSFCGPDKNKDLFHYCANGQPDDGMALILRRFQTLYPFLNLIAKSNYIKDPFDERVVEAYWLGNRFLEKVTLKQLYVHLTEKQQLKKKLNLKDFNKLKTKISKGAVPHHNFHVLNSWKGAINSGDSKSVSAMDLCKISWGKVVEINKGSLEVEYQPIVLKADKLDLGKKVNHTVNLNIDNAGFIEVLEIGDWISFHWNFACEKLALGQVANLEKYTRESIRIANRATSNK